MNGLRENGLGNDKCRTVVPPRPVLEVGNIFSEAKLLFYAGETPTFHMLRFDAYLHTFWTQNSKAPCPRMKMRGDKTSTSDLVRETPEPPNLTCMAGRSPETVRWSWESNYGVQNMNISTLLHPPEWHICLIFTWFEQWTASKINISS